MRREVRLFCSTDVFIHRRDTAGQERYKVCTTPLLETRAADHGFSLWYVYARLAVRHRPISNLQAPMYYRNANCAVVVYDITQSASLEKARSWIRELQRQADPSIIIALCGNKSDLAARRQVTQEEAKKYAEEEGLMWGETSAKSGEGVTEIFTDIGSSPWTLILISLLNMLRHSQEAPQECAAICPRSWRPTGCSSSCWR